MKATTFHVILNCTVTLLSDTADANCKSMYLLLRVEPGVGNKTSPEIENTSRSYFLFEIS